MTPSQTQPHAVDVDELKQAWNAVTAGEFRGPRSHAATPGHAAAGERPTRWQPAPREQVVPILGAAGGVGATTTALAIAAAHRADSPVRVVECGPPATSGLASASTAELGTTPTSEWKQGKRDHVLLERPTRHFTTPEEAPVPETVDGHDSQLTLLDMNWDPIQLFAARTWLADTLATTTELVVVTTATVPGFRRLETVLELTDQLIATVRVAVIGPKRWPKAATSAAGVLTRTLLAEDGRVVRLPHHRRLAITGLDSRPLPDRLLTAAAGLITHPEPIVNAQLEEPTP